MKKVRNADKNLRNYLNNAGWGGGDAARAVDGAGSGVGGVVDEKSSKGRISVGRGLVCGKRRTDILPHVGDVLLSMLSDNFRYASYPTRVIGYYFFIYERLAKWRIHYKQSLEHLSCRTQIILMISRALSCYNQ